MQVNANQHLALLLSSAETAELPGGILPSEAAAFTVVADSLTGLIKACFL